MKKLFAIIITVIMICIPLALNTFAAEETYEIYQCDMSEDHVHERTCLTDRALQDLENAEELLNVPTLQEIQSQRATTYAKGNFGGDQNAAAEAFEAYVEDSMAKRADAQNAYDALPAELQAFISEELYAKLGDLDTVMNALTKDITAGSGEYTFQSVYSPAYEMSNHMVSSDGGASNSIPQTLLLVDASEDYTWTPDGEYSFATSNYEVLYCCDFDTGYAGGIHYKRMNLEESDYYDEESAAKIRAIITNSYPYVSLEQMKENLAADGFEGAEDLSRSEIISAVQVAVWSYANGTGDLVYSQTFDVNKNTQWGTVLHDYSNELFDWWEVGKRKFYVDTDAGDRINRLIEYLKGQTSIYADKNQIIISDIEILSSTPVQEKDGLYKVAMEVELNNSGSSNLDEIYVYAYVDGIEYKCEKVELGTEKYTMILEVENGKEITVRAAGSQIIPEGVYFYQPVGGRNVSQSLVGVAKGETQVFAESKITVEVENEDVFGNLVLNKTDENALPLTGAEFALFVNGENGMILIDSFTVDENGMIEISNLLPGSYSLEEITATEGYYKLEEIIKFNISEEDGSCVLLSEIDWVDVELTEDESVITVINVRIPTINDKVTVSGSKTWDDEGYEDKRPDSVTVYVMDEEAEVAKKTVTAADNWEWSFELPKFRLDMTEIVYTIREDEVPGYVTVYDGYNIINKYLVDNEEPGDSPDNPPGSPEYGYPEEDKPPIDGGGDSPGNSSPQTGDSAVLLVILTIIFTAATVVLLRFRRRRI